jgi:hypothetical protein
VHGSLLSDPYERVKPFELRRLHGNIGRPGLTVLVSPVEPKIRSNDEYNWRVVTNAEYDGTAIDAFGDTSMHLSFTDFLLPITVESIGNRDYEACILESVISVHHKGKWIADVDVLKAIDDNIILLPNVCEGQCSAPSTSATSADNWEEIFEPQAVLNVARSRGNWIGRLALVSIAYRLYQFQYLLPPDGCPSCLESISRRRLQKALVIM